MSSDLFPVADTEVRLRAVGHSIGLIVASFVPAVVFGVGAGLVAGLLGVSLDPSSLPVTVAFTVVQYAGFMLIVGAYLHTRDERALVGWSTPGLRELGWAAAAFAGLFVTGILLSVVLTALNVQPATNRIITQGRENPALFLAMIPLTILLVAPGEELLFRGVVQSLFRRAYGSVLAVAAASVLFGAVHFVAMPPEASTVQVLAALAQAGTLGVILGAVYERTRNIVIPVLAHGAWNAMIFVFQYVAAVYDIAPAGV